MTLDSLDALEAKIQEAAERLIALAEQNSELERRLAEADERIAALEAAPGEDGDAANDGGAAWAAEKAELQRRVERLVARLEELLESTAD